MEKEEKQFKVLLEILEKFHSAGVLEEMMTIIYQNLPIKVPEPAVFALHKLIISARRLNETAKNL